MFASRLFAALFGLCVALPASAAEATVQGRDPVITVLGKGTYEIKPDLARFNVVLTTEEKAIDAAGKAHEVRATQALALLQGLKASGVEIEKSSFRIDEKRVQQALTETQIRQGRRPETVVAGYVAKSVFSLKTAALDNLNTLVSKLAESGLFEIDSVRFHVVQDRAALNQARRLAMLDAREQARAYVEPVDLELGSIVAITDGEAAPLMGEADLPARRAPSGSYSLQILPPATVSFIATVNVTWRITPR
ncbi:SIMPL domain-containing protein [Microvirga terricola]|uniref:SIMPL domain-containing protein n=1 Tax=Microvirga terricola TaxID=2719797 RepID=A0ABX0VCG5_9HYPH|nr:SIMPL domain-containing protein [Microvirga terricola]NIX77193.1 SIMPL domain-containing protein [Microvirga terricola]